MKRPTDRLPLSILLWTCLAAGLLLSGCVAGGDRVTQFYTLESLAPPRQPSATGAKAGTAPLAVEVAALRLPQYLERPQIVTRRDGNRLFLSEFNQWGGNLQKDLMRTMALNFSLLLDTPQVSITPYHPPTPPDYRVEVEIMRFEQEENGEVTLLAQWRLLQRQAKEAVATRMTTLSGTPSSSTDAYAGTVATMSRLWGELCTIIAQAMQQDARGR